MKVVLLAGGFGSRISEESQFKPKPMIEIGGMPILWHIMKDTSVKGMIKKGVKEVLGEEMTKKVKGIIKK